MTPTPHFRTCNLCEAMCGVRIDVEEGRITSIRGDERDRLSRGYLCPKAVALRDLHEDPDRLKQPVRRGARGWEPISWDEALDEAARGIHRVQSQHGPDAAATYLGNPTVHNFGAMVFITYFLQVLGTKNRFAATSVDHLPHLLASYLMFGHQYLLPVSDVDHTRYWLVLGANPIASNGSVMAAPDLRGRIRALRARGGKLVVLDPRRTETAEMADEHFFIKPGSDAWFLLGVLSVILEKGPRLGRLAAFTDGLDRLREATRGHSPERAEPHTGLPAAVTRRLAEELLAAESGVCYGRVGTSTQAFGGLCQWLINAINVTTGNLDRQGGALFSLPAMDLVTLPPPLAPSRGSFGRWRTRVRGLPEFGGDMPVAALGEEILTEGPGGRVRALLTYAGNPVLATPNGGQVDRALSSLDFMVAIDPYVNETTRHAHLILPPPSPLERSHYDVIFQLLGLRNTAKYAPPLFDPGPSARHDWQILLGLAERLELARRGPSLARTLQYRALGRLGPEGVLDISLRLGPYGPRLRPLRKGLSLSRLRSEPHGVDLGPLSPCLPERLKTAGKRIDLAPAPFLADLSRLHKVPSAPEADDALLLIGRRHVRDNNSWMHNVPMLVRGKPRCTLLMHPEDAQRRSLGDGDLVTVTSRVGRIQAPLRVSDEVMPGVVSLPHGYGHGRPGVRQTVASQHAGVSINDLTDDQAIDALTGNAAFSGVPVRVERAEAGALEASSDAPPGAS